MALCKIILIINNLHKYREYTILLMFFHKLFMQKPNVDSKYQADIKLTALLYKVLMMSLHDKLFFHIVFLRIRRLFSIDCNP